MTEFQIDISPVTVEDLYEKLYLSDREGSLIGESRLLPTVNENFILGMYYKRWNSDILIPYELGKTVRHITELVEPFTNQANFWIKKYDRDPSNALMLFEYLYANYMTDDADTMKLLAVFYGVLHGMNLGLWWIPTYENRIVLVRTASDLVFIGCCKMYRPGEVTLTQAYEISDSEYRGIDDLFHYGRVQWMIEDTRIFDVSEIRECYIEDVSAFCKRLDIHTYDPILERAKNTKTDKDEETKDRQ